MVFEFSRFSRNSEFSGSSEVLCFANCVVFLGSLVFCFLDLRSLMLRVLKGLKLFSL